MLFSDDNRMNIARTPENIQKENPVVWAGEVKLKSKLKLQIKAHITK